MSTVLAIAGSPRRHGNSTTLLRRALVGANEAGARTALIHLDDVPIAGCRGCAVCSGNAEGECVQRDGMRGVLAALRLADVWLLGFPIYYDMPCGPFKTFFDRCRTLSRVRGERHPSLPGKRHAGIFITYEDKQRADYVQVARTLGGYLNWFGDFGEAEILDGAGLGPPDAASGRPDLLQRAFEIGTRLAAS